MKTQEKQEWHAPVYVTDNSGDCEIRWELSKAAPSQVNKRANGLTGWARVVRRSCGALLPGDGPLRKFHVCAHNPCPGLSYDSSKYGVSQLTGLSYDPPEHVQPCAWRPVAGDVANTGAAPPAAGEATPPLAEGGVAARIGTQPRRTLPWRRGGTPAAQVASAAATAHTGEKAAPESATPAAADTGASAAAAASGPGPLGAAVAASGTAGGAASAALAASAAAAAVQGVTAPALEQAPITEGAPEPLPAPAVSPPPHWPVPPTAPLPQRSVPAPLPPDPSASEPLSVEQAPAENLPYTIVVGGHHATLEKLLALARAIRTPRTYVGHSAFLLFALSRNRRIFAWEGENRKDLLALYAPWAVKDSTTDAPVDVIACAPAGGRGAAARASRRGLQSPRLPRCTALRTGSPGL